LGLIRSTYKPFFPRIPTAAFSFLSETSYKDWPFRIDKGHEGFIPAVKDYLNNEETAKTSPGDIRARIEDLLEDCFPPYATAWSPLLLTGGKTPYGRCEKNWQLALLFKEWKRRGLNTRECFKEFPGHDPGHACIASVLTRSAEACTCSQERFLKCTRRYQPAFRDCLRRLGFKPPSARRGRRHNKI